MNIPNSFKFKHLTSSETNFAEKENDRFIVKWKNNQGELEGCVTYSINEVENSINEGWWRIIDEQSTYEAIGQKIGKLVDEKNKQYGDSFHKSGDFLKILYPNGIKPEQYKDMLGLVRIFDKQMRIANGNKGEENAFFDIVGYGILMSGGKTNE